MTDTNASTGTADAGTTDTSDTTSTDATTDTGKPDVDWKAKAREWERRAKENSTAAQRLAELEQAQMTEAQRAQAERDAARQEATDAKAEALRYRIASKFGISDEDAETFLTGTDEDAITKQAERLASMSKPADTTTAPGPRPDLSQGARSGQAAQGDPAKDFANFLGSQLKR